MSTRHRATACLATLALFLAGLVTLAVAAQAAATPVSGTLYVGGSVSSGVVSSGMCTYSDSDSSQPIYISTAEANACLNAGALTVTNTVGDVVVNAMLSGGQGTLSLTSTSGYVSNAADLSTDSAGGAGSSVIGQLVGSAGTSFRMSGAIAEIGNVSASSINVSTTGDVTVSGTVQSTSGAVFLDALGSLTLSGAVSSAADMFLDGYTSVTQASGSSITCGGSLSLDGDISSPGGPVSLTSTSNSIPTLGIVKVNGAVSVVTSTALTVTGANTGYASGVSTGNSALTVVAGGALAIDTPINIGTAALSLSGAGITQNSSGVLTAGQLTANATSGSVTLTGNNAVNYVAGSSSSNFALSDTNALTLAGSLTVVGNATLTTGNGGAISESASGALSAQTASINAGGSATLTGSNAVATLTGSAGGPLTFTNTTAMTVGALTTIGAINVRSGGNLSVSGLSGQGAVVLDAGTNSLTLATMSSVSAGTTVSFFSGSREQTSVTGATVQGATVTRGPEYKNSATERWNDPSASPAPATGSYTFYYADQGHDAVALAFAPTSSTYGAAVAITATVTPSGGSGMLANPTGTVRFYLGSSTTPIACAEGSAVTLSANSGTNTSSATCTTSSIDQGSTQVSATYVPDATQPATGSTSYAGGSSPAATYTVGAASPTVSTVTSNAAGNESNSGDAVTFMTTVSGPSGAAQRPTGTVTFLSDGSSIGGCSSVALTVVNNAEQASCTTSALSPGQHAITATYQPDSTRYNSASTATALTFVVDTPPSATTTSLTLSPMSAAEGASVTATARVSPSPGGGTVQFSVDGTNVGSPVALDAGHDTATTTLHTTDLSVGQHTVVASYAGAGTFEPSSGQQSLMVTAQTTPPKITNPTIKASLSSSVAKTKYGWSRKPVTVGFSCVKGSAPVSCPEPFVVRYNGRHVVTRTITASDGGTASVSVHVDVDLVAPRVGVRGAKDGATYRTERTLVCDASDNLSGVASCHVATHRRRNVVRWTATATDKAGNTASSVGFYRLRS